MSLRLLSPPRLAGMAVLALVFLAELVKSSVFVARLAFARDPRMRSGIIAYPIALRTEFGTAMLANLITLTPGTCSLHVSEDRRTLYIHALDITAPEEIIAGIRTAFEDRIRRIEG